MKQEVRNQTGRIPGSKRKRARLYIGSTACSKDRTFDNSGFSAQGAFISTYAVPAVEKRMVGIFVCKGSGNGCKYGGYLCLQGAGNGCKYGGYHCLQRRGAVIKNAG